MIKIKAARWGNTFSYGDGNSLELDQNQITQLLGKNGGGKSSVGLILEEGLFNKNSKGIKKADILNRYSSAKSYWIEIDFDKDGEDYHIKTTRGSTQTVKLYKGTEDISAHTATNTFKMIEDILGFDHKTFSQLIYQSSSSSLEFLVATDTNRKKFLIELLNLTRYVDAFEIFKGVAKQVSDEVLQIETKIKTTQSWLDKHNGTSLEPQAFCSVPDQPAEQLNEVGTLTSQIKTMEVINKQIIQNNQYKKLLKEIPVEELTKVVEPPKDIKPYISKRGEHLSTVKAAEQFIKKISHLSGSCPTCLQDIDNAKLDSLVKEQEQIILEASTLAKELDTTISILESNKKEFDKVTKYKTDWESYHSLIDENTPTELLDKETLEVRVKRLQAEIVAVQKEVKLAEQQNNEVSAHNSKIEVIKGQIDEMNKDLQVYSDKLKIVADRLNIVQLLQKTFSTNGLIAYKIECLVKDLEELTNKYLGDLSGGRFQISFIVVSDKLNVVITDNGKDIDILALSSGERARVNTATLLAIRRMMQSLSNARINLLILDETIENLDIEGKEKLIEVLLQEEHLNTILISHGFSHPLLEKITVVKENNISRIEL